MKKISIHTTDYCSFCTRTKGLLDSLGLAFEEYKVDREDIQAWQDLEKRSGLKTMPQIFIDELCIGGFQELHAMNESGELKKILAKE